MKISARVRVTYHIVEMLFGNIRICINTARMKLNF